MADENNLLLQPTSVASVNGILETSIHLKPATHHVGGSNFSLTTRTLNGTMPGPTLRVKPGDTLLIDFYNDLEDQNIPYIHNQFSAPDESNLHFHGLHVSGELPSDDGTLVVQPGKSYRYNITIPSDHMPGLHWLHPHRHGSTALQVGGGAVAAIVVQDNVADNETRATLPFQVLDAREVLMIVQNINADELGRVASQSHDSLLRMSGWNQERHRGLQDQGDRDKDRRNKDKDRRNKDRDQRNKDKDQRNKDKDRRNKDRDKSTRHRDEDGGEDTFLINGQLNPTIPLQPGEWIRMRIIFAGWLEGKLNLSIPGCEMQLIAKDGIYIRDLPRAIEQAILVNAARADVMVRCDGPSEAFSMVQVTRQGNNPIATLKTSTGPAVESTAIEQPDHPIQYPTYLADLRDTPPTPGCACSTKVEDLVYRSKTDYLHTTFPGAIVERSIISQRHPYHQHVYPFQIISGFRDDDLSNHYYQLGDWHDTIQDSGVIRYMPTVFTGKVMFHCHILTHEDEGMMGIEYIDPKSESCQCGTLPERNDRDDRDFQASVGDGSEDDFSAYMIIAIIVAGALLLFVAMAGLHFRRRKRHRKRGDGS